MWYLVLMSGKWYAVEVFDGGGLRDALDNILDHANEGAIVTITDDLDTFCDEMNVNRDAIVEVE